MYFADEHRLRRPPLRPQIRRPGVWMRRKLANPPQKVVTNRKVRPTGPDLSRLCNTVLQKDLKTLLAAFPDFLLPLDCLEDAACRGRRDIKHQHIVQLVVQLTLLFENLAEVGAGTCTVELGE